MLRSLTIENYAIIEQLDICFEPGLNIITGQTGAGKSILLGALGLLSGGKADASTLLNPEKNCILEASFNIAPYGLQDYFEANDIDYSDVITIRRVIAPTGKHRAFIEDQPVTQTQLKELSEKLIDIHSQHQSLLLSHSDFQTKIIDSVAGQLPAVDAFRKLFAEFKSKQKELDKLKISNEESAKRREFLEYHVEEIDSLKIQSGECITLEEELQTLTHASDITECLSAAHNMADEPDQGYITLIHRALQQINSVKKHYAPLNELYERLNSSYIELKDIDSEIYDIMERMEVNPARKEQLEKRLDAINSLFHKHNLSTEQELLDLKESMDNELWNMTLGENKVEELETEICKMHEKLTAQAGEISKQRKKASTIIERHTIDTMRALGIKDANFTIEISTASELSSSGIDIVKFLFSANATVPPQPIEKVASGGEISRLMLALKGLVSRKISLPTVIFDEIDTGVSGSIADKMGQIISEMGDTMQVVNITHLPQVASKGKHHYYVYKDSGTHIKKLSDTERVERIAEMLSGANITEAARVQARELLAN